MLALTTAVQADCSQAKTQFDINQCELDNYSNADIKMNAAYKKLVADFKDSKNSNSLGIASKKHYLSSLLNSQRAWLKYRDSQCDFEALFSEGGSAQPALYSNCLRELTETRTKELTSNQKLSAE